MKIVGTSQRRCSAYQTKSFEDDFNDHGLLQEGALEKRQKSLFFPMNRILDFMGCSRIRQKAKMWSFFAFWASVKGRGSGVGGYFLAGRKMNWFLIGCSLIGSNFGGEHLVGLAGSGAASGIGVANFEIQVFFGCRSFCYVGLDFRASIFCVRGKLLIMTATQCFISDSQLIYTMPEYIRKRFGGRRIPLYLSGISFLLYVLIKLAADLFSGAIFIKIVLGWNLYWAILLQLAVACISTASGGLRAVMWTDTVQVIIMFTGLIALMFISFQKVGGYTSMTEQYFTAVPNSSFVFSNDAKCAGMPKRDALSWAKPIDNMEMPWLGGIFGYYSMALIVQKAISGRNYSHAKGGCIMAAFFKLTTMWFMVFPGMIARILYPNELACTDPKVCQEICYSPNGCSNIAFPILVTRLLPIGLKGVMAAVMMSAIMGSLSSIFNSISSIFTFDVWPVVRKNPTTLEQLIVGRVFVIVMVVIAVCWLPIIAAYPNSQLFVYVQSVTCYLAPPVSATFLLAVLVPWSNEKVTIGAFWSLMIGLIIGLTRLILEVSFQAPTCFEPDLRPDFLTKVHYLHFALALFGFCCLLNLSISYFTLENNFQKPDSGLTFWSRKETTSKFTKPSFPHDSGTSQKRAKLPTSKLKRFMYFICGLDEQEMHMDVTHHNEERCSLTETLFWRVTTNVLGISAVTALIFVYCVWA
uniref:Sodium/glucose cotransporter n=1 Tax=Romanomermis culicivorax TaxID=13658 RepID=A0A915HLS6_ROMCU